MSYLCRSVANVPSPPGRTETFAFLFDMNQLFEEFIAELVRRVVWRIHPPRTARSLAITRLDVPRPKRHPVSAMEQDHQSNAVVCRSPDLASHAGEGLLSASEHAGLTVSDWGNGYRAMTRATDFSVFLIRSFISLFSDDTALLSHLSPSALRSKGAR